jgi:hypothetical protein
MRNDIKEGIHRIEARTAGHYPSPTSPRNNFQSTEKAGANMDGNK